MASRVDGQIWIDRNSPYKLKYHFKGKTYVVENSATFKLNVTNDTTFENLEVGNTYIYAGTLLALDGEASDSKIKVRPAKFPGDIPNILGVALNNIKKLDKISTTEAIISKSGYLLIDAPSKVFEEATDNSLAIPEDIESTSLVGSPIYWFIGKTNIEGDAFKYKYEETDRGKLTMHLPVGSFENRKTKASLNIGYTGLPRVGVITGFSSSNGTTIDSLELYLNFSNFSSSINWTWPAIHNGTDPLIDGKIEDTVEGKKQISKDIKIRHGLFADVDNSSNVKAFCDIIALKEHEDETTGEEENIQIIAPIINTTKGEDRLTQITISSPEALFYRISGRVDYKFDEGNN